MCESFHFLFQYLYFSLSHVTLNVYIIIIFSPLTLFLYPTHYNPLPPSFPLTFPMIGISTVPQVSAPQ